MPVPKKAAPKKLVRREKPLLTKDEVAVVVPAKKTVKKRTGGRTRTGPIRLAQTEAKERAFELHLKGWSLRKIAAQVTEEGYQVSYGTINNWIDEECEERLKPLVPRVRAVELARYDSYLLKIEEDLENGGDVPKLVSTAVRVSEARRRLLGADAPQQTELLLSGEVHTPEILQKVSAYAEEVQRREAVARAAQDAADAKADEETSDVKTETPQTETAGQ